MLRLATQVPQFVRELESAAGRAGSGTSAPRAMFRRQRFGKQQSSFACRVHTTSSMTTTIATRNARDVLNPSPCNPTKTTNNEWQTYTMSRRTKVTGRRIKLNATHDYPFTHAVAMFPRTRSPARPSHAHAPPPRYIAHEGCLRKDALDAQRRWQDAQVCLKHGTQSREGVRVGAGDHIQSKALKGSLAVRISADAATVGRAGWGERWWHVSLDFRARSEEVVMRPSFLCYLCCQGILRPPFFCGTLTMRGLHSDENVTVTVKTKSIFCVSFLRIGHRGTNCRHLIWGFILACW